MIWLIGTHFGHGHPYYRMMKQRAQESLDSQENVGAIFMFVG